jgi:hypothetical protein
MYCIGNGYVLYWQWLCTTSALSGLCTVLAMYCMYWHCHWLCTVLTMYYIGVVIGYVLYWPCRWLCTVFAMYFIGLGYVHKASLWLQITILVSGTCLLQVWFHVEGVPDWIVKDAQRVGKTQVLVSGLEMGARLYIRNPILTHIPPDPHTHIPTIQGPTRPTYLSCI